MEILVCVKRVPMVGGKIVVTPDGQDVDTRMSGFTVSPHEECAVEEAVRIAGRLGGSVTALTLGPPEAADQLRDMLALGAGHGVLLETGGRPWGPIATAAAITDAARRRAEGPDGGYDLLLFGNEAADTGDYQVPVRVAHALGLPCVTGIKELEILAGDDGEAGGGDGGAGRGDAAGGGFGGAGGEAGPWARARREYRGTQETFDIPLPAVVTVKEGINLPRYPSLPGRLRAKRAVIERFAPPWQAEGLRTQRLRVPQGERKRAQILGTGPGAVPALVQLLDELGVLP
jgi:electron transfer flavoprotein beta subunit